MTASVFLLMLLTPNGASPRAIVRVTGNSAAKRSLMPPALPWMEAAVRSMLLTVPASSSAVVSMSPLRAAMSRTSS